MLHALIAATALAGAPLDSQYVLERYATQLLRVDAPKTLVFTYSISQAGPKPIEQSHRIYRSGELVRDETLQVEGQTLKVRPTRIARYRNRYTIESLAPRMTEYAFLFLRSVRSAGSYSYTYKAVALGATGPFVIVGMTIDGRTFLPSEIRFRSASPVLRGTGSVSFAEADKYWVPTSALVQASIGGKPARERIELYLVSISAELAEIDVPSTTSAPRAGSAAILKRASRSLWLAWIAVPFVVYAMTVQGHISYWDTAEMQTVPWIFGIPHPTGFPAFVLIAGAFAHVFAFGTVSWRISFFCALLMLACVALVCAAVVTVTRDRLSGICAALLLAFGWFFWIYGVRAEIHTMAALCGAIALYFALRGYYDADARSFCAASLAFGLGLASHPIVLLTLPSLLLLGFSRRRVFSRRSVAIAILLAIAPLVLYAYLPLRSHAITARGLDPAAQLGKPLGAAIWNSDNPQTPNGFIRLVTGSDFNAAKSVARIADLPFYAAKSATFFEAMYREFTPVGALAACLCLGILFYRRAAVAFALLFAIMLPAAFALAYPPVVQIERYFFIPMIAVAMSIGLGIAALDERYRNLLRLPLAAAALYLLVANYSDAHLRAVSGAEGLIARVRILTPPNAIIIADWARGTALSYESYVMGRFRDRTIDIAWPYQDARYLRGWLAERPVYYVGRPVAGSRRILLCAVSGEYPIYAVHAAPGHC